MAFICVLICAKAHRTIRRISTSRQELWPATFNHRIEPQPMSIDSFQETQYLTSVAGQATSGLRRRKGCDPKSNIWKAAEEGDVEEIERQLESGVDVNAYSQPHGTPLSVAAYNGRVNVVELLLKKHAEVNGYYGRRETALHSAAERGHEVIVRSLLKQGANMNAKVCGATALHVAACKGHWGSVQILLEFGTDHLPKKIPPYIFPKSQNGLDTLHILLDSFHECDYSMKYQQLPYYLGQIIYAEVLEEDIHTIFGPQLYFLRGNALIDTTCTVRELFVKMGIDVPEWPPYSPDLNSIMHLRLQLMHLVSQVNPQIDEFGYGTAEIWFDLCKAVDKTSYLIEEDILTDLVGTRRRIQAFIEAGR